MAPSIRKAAGAPPAQRRDGTGGALATMLRRDVVAWRHYRDAWWVKPRGALERLLSSDDPIPGAPPGGKGWWRAPLDFYEVAGSPNDTRDLFESVAVPTLRRALRPYQAEAVRFAVERKRVLLADGMRLGKTFEALATATPLGATADAPWVILVPASKLYDWADEATTVLPPPWSDASGIHILRGRKATAPPPGWAYILNYEIVDAWLTTLLSLRPAGVILDESVYVKGRQSRRSRATTALCDAARMAVLALSGEPVENRPSDLWGQLRCVRGPRDFGKFWQFHRRYCGGVINEWGGYDYTTATHPEELKERLYAFTIRRTKYDATVAGALPRTTRQILRVEGAPHAAEIAAAQIVAAAARDGERTVVFTFYRATARAMVEEVGKALRAVGLPVSTPLRVVTGEDDARSRAAALREMASIKGAAVLVATIDSIGLGLDLSTFDGVVFVELHYVPTRLLQAEERVYAVGRTRPIGIHYCVVNGGEDERVAQMVVDKLGQIESIVGPDAASAGLTEALSGGVPTVGRGGVVTPLLDLVARLREVEAETMRLESRTPRTARAAVGETC